MKFIIFDFSRFVVYKAHRRLNINEVYKNHRFKYWITLHAILKSVFFNSIENVLKVIVWNSNHVNLVNNNVIEVLHLSFVREFNFINMNSIDFRIYSLYIKLINVYDLNRETRFYKYVNLRCIFDWCSFV